MKTIKHSFGTNLDWVEPFAKQLGGKFENNFIIIDGSPDDPQESRYVLDCGNGIVAYYVDGTYNKDYHFIHQNKSTDFIGLYYNLTDGEESVFNVNNLYKVGRWQSNFAVIDSGLQTEYSVKEGTKTFLLIIFIKKENIVAIAKENNITFQNIHKITDSKKNTIVRFDRMNSESYNIINDLRKLKVGGAIFDLNLNGTVHLLLYNFLKMMSAKKIIIQTVNEIDLASIIDSQLFLIENIEDHFPSIKIMSDRANMSESKFQILFKKITGTTPNSFFIENKLYRSKELIEDQQLSIAEISDKLKFSSHSYFASSFKKHFGLSPKVFAKQL
jgi:AraC-like DNA-binding protein